MRLLYSLLLGHGLGLIFTSGSLALSLDFLEGTSLDLTFLVDDLVSQEEFLLVELSSSLWAVVKESESSGSATSEFGVETKDGDVLWLRFEHSGKLVLDESLGDGSRFWVDKLNGNLLSAHEWVVDDLSGVEHKFTVFVSHINNKFLIKHSFQI